MNWPWNGNEKDFQINLSTIKVSLTRAIEQCIIISKMWINGQVTWSTIKIQEARKGSCDIKSASDWPNEAKRCTEISPGRWLSYRRGYIMVRIFATGPWETVLEYRLRQHHLMVWFNTSHQYLSLGEWNLSFYSRRYCISRGPEFITFLIFVLSGSSASFFS